MGSEVREMALRLGLSDITKERHPEGVPPTYVRSNSARRIDLLLGSSRVLGATMKYGMILNGYEILGDHRPQYLDINIKEILQMNSLDLGSQSSRRLRSTDVKAVKSYCENVHSHFKNHKIYDRMERLYEETKNQVIMTSEQIEKYEALDRDVYRLCTNAEKTIKLFPFTKYV